MSCFYTIAELSRLHRRFGHPSVDKLAALLRRADPKKFSESTRNALQKITDECRLCQFESQRPRRFKFTIRDEKTFNPSIYIDVQYIDSKPILHVVDEATLYQAARWLDKVSAEEVWKALRLCWIDVYVGPPDMITHDAATNFLSKNFGYNASLMHISTKSVPVEAEYSMSIVERYHSPLRRAYRIIRAEAPSMDKESALQAAVKALNDSAGPDGLIPTLLVYGALPRLGFPTDGPSPTTIERAVAVRKATKQL